MPEREPYEGDLHSVGELTSPPLAANEPGPSRGVSPVGFVASEPSETVRICAGLLPIQTFDELTLSDLGVGNCVTDTA